LSTIIGFEIENDGNDRDGVKEEGVVGDYEGRRVSKKENKTMVRYSGRVE